MSPRQPRTVAMVSGAASGIGRAVAEQLQQAGCTVALLDRDEAALHATARELCGRPGPAPHAFALDVTSADAVERCVAAVESELGPIHKLALVAGVLRMGSATQVSQEDLQTCLNVNLGGVFQLSRAVSRPMMARGSGAIVTVASNAGHTPRIDMAAYATSKAAASMYTRCLGLELSAYGIRCNVVAPGTTDTPMLRGAWGASPAAPQAAIEGDLSRHRLGIPLGRIAHPSEVAHVVCFLLSDEARHLTLQEVRVDGGSTF